MSGKKKKHKHGAPRQLSPLEMERGIIELFTRYPQDRWDVKRIARRLNATNLYAEMEQLLAGLCEKNVLAINRNGKYKLAQLPQGSHENAIAADVLIGTVDMTRSGDAYITSDQKKGKDVFVPKNRLRGALHGDTVRVRWNPGRRGRPEGSVVEILQRKTIYFVGTLFLSRNRSLVSPDDPRMGSEIWIDKTLLKGAQNEDKVVVAIRQWQNENKEGILQGEVIHNLGKAGSNNAEMQGILIQNGFNVTFPEEVVEESEKIPTEITADEISRRRDFRQILTFTIDPEDAKDFDDAISLQTLENGNYEIGVHIADVSHYVKPGTEVDKEAARRTTSVYLVDRVAPMLPEKLSNVLCSLRPNEEKLTFSAVFEFTPTGKIISEWFGRTIICSARRYSYEEVQAILESGKGDYVDALKTVNKFAQQIRKERFKKGAINFESAEVKFRLDENGKPLVIIPKVRKEAHFLIEEFMLLANRRVSAYIDSVNAHRKVSVPFVYRVHDLPDMDKIADFTRFAAELGYMLDIKSPKQVAPAFSKMQEQSLGKPEADVLQQLGIRTMAKATYTTNNIGHFGLAFETYTHFTSPIRRYSDVLSHRILFEVLNNGSSYPKKEELEAQCKHISSMERKAMDAERESIKYKQAEYMQEHVGDMFEGVISGITDYGIFVELLENFSEGMVKIENMYDDFMVVDGGMHIRAGKRMYKMGDRVWVLIISANPHKRQIDMRLLDETKIDKSTAKTLNVKRHEGESLAVAPNPPKEQQPTNKTRKKATAKTTEKPVESSVVLPPAETKPAKTTRKKASDKQPQSEAAKPVEITPPAVEEKPKTSRTRKPKETATEQPEVKTPETPVAPKAEEKPKTPRTRKPKETATEQPEVKIPETPIAPKAEEKPKTPRTRKPKETATEQPEVKTPETPVVPKAEEKPKTPRTRKPKTDDK